MKLKTLKDLRFEKSCSDIAIAAVSDNIRDRFIQENKLYTEFDLKQEAIKWIKELNFRKERFFPDLHAGNSVLISIDWIKHFFNITEEDIKASGKATKDLEDKK